MRRLALMLVAVATLTALSAGSAFANYGPGALYQIEISSNVTGPHGGGIWLWIEFTANGGGDYAGSDCGRGADERPRPDRGDVQLLVDERRQPHH